MFPDLNQDFMKSTTSLSSLISGTCVLCNKTAIEGKKTFNFNQNFAIQFFQIKKNLMLQICKRKFLQCKICQPIQF